MFFSSCKGAEKVSFTTVGKTLNTSFKGAFLSARWKLNSSSEKRSIETHFISTLFIINFKSSPSLGKLTLLK